MSTHGSEADTGLLTAEQKNWLTDRRTDRQVVSKSLRCFFQHRGVHNTVRWQPYLTFLENHFSVDRNQKLSVYFSDDWNQKLWVCSSVDWNQNLLLFHVFFFFKWKWSQFLMLTLFIWFKIRRVVMNLNMSFFNVSKHSLNIFSTAKTLQTSSWTDKRNYLMTRVMCWPLTHMWCHHPCPRLTD